MDAYPDIPWRQIVAQRSMLIHNYLGIDEKIVWDVVNKHLPVLKMQIEAILKERE